MLPGVHYGIMLCCWKSDMLQNSITLHHRILHYITIILLYYITKVLLHNGIPLHLDSVLLPEFKYWQYVCQTRNKQVIIYVTIQKAAQSKIFVSVA